MATFVLRGQFLAFECLYQKRETLKINDQRKTTDYQYQEWNKDITEHKTLRE